MNEKDEEWRPIPSWPTYEASSLGRIRTIATKHIKSTRIRPDNGYEDVGLVVGSVNKRVLVSRLVCEAFHGAPPTRRHQAAHNNGKNRDNAASNLRWSTPRANHADKKIHGTLLVGSRIQTARLSEISVLAIIEAHSKGAKVKDLANEHGVHFATVYRVLNGTTWNHTTGERT